MTRENDLETISFATKYDLGNDEERELYGQLMIALRLMDDDFRLLFGGIGENGIDFGIVTPYPQGLPERVGLLFFNVDAEFKVVVEETAQQKWEEMSKRPSERFFNINIKHSPAPQSNTKKN